MSNTPTHPSTLTDADVERIEAAHAGPNTSDPDDIATFVPSSMAILPDNPHEIDLDDQRLRLADWESIAYVRHYSGMGMTVLALVDPDSPNPSVSIALDADQRAALIAYLQEADS